MDYDKLRRRPVQFIGVTGFNVDDFDYLLSEFRVEWDDYNTHYTLEGKLRQRQTFTRKDSVLPKVSDKLLFLLIYLKTNPLQEHHAASFGITQSQANGFIHLFSGILRKTLKRLGELPSRNEYRIEHLIGSFEDVLLDGTERPIQRPQASDLQKACYSGKKNS